MMKPFILCLLFCCLLGCGEKPSSDSALPLTQETTCAVDGMILLDYAGPKAQILWKNGQRTYYCEAREAFSTWLSPVQKQRILGFFLQDMGGVPWGAYADRWHPANNLHLVIDSKKSGSMGLSYVSFLNLKDAKSFQSTYGGRLLTLIEITPDVLAHSEELMHQHPDDYSPTTNHQMPK